MIGMIEEMMVGMIEKMMKYDVTRRKLCCLVSKQNRQNHAALSAPGPNPVAVQEPYLVALPPPEQNQAA